MAGMLKKSAHFRRLIKERLLPTRRHSYATRSALLLVGQRLLTLCFRVFASRGDAVYELARDIISSFGLVGRGTLSFR